MRNTKRINKIGHSVLILLLFLVSITTFLTEQESDNQTTTMLKEYHQHIIGILIIMSIAVGFYWSRNLDKEVEKSEKQTKNILNTVLLFLNDEEKQIINHLVNNSGQSKQSIISEIEGMNRVKTHRSLQKLNAKNILRIKKDGKIRIIELNEEIYKVLVEN